MHGRGAGSAGGGFSLALCAGSGTAVGSYRSRQDDTGDLTLNMDRGRMGQTWKVTRSPPEV